MRDVFLAVHADGAGRSCKCTGEDFDQGGFAGAVLSDQTVNRVFVDSEADIINGPNAWKFFGQVFYFQQNSTHELLPVIAFQGEEAMVAASSREKINHTFKYDSL
jgi:hypothetical protein